jgi:large subunit ribosomal protein L4e
MAAARPVVSVYKFDSSTGEKEGTMPMPVPLMAPLRPDLVRLVHMGISKNKRQAYAMSYRSGYQTAAESWGTGRAVARIPRVPGGGTHRSGQAAFGNMCRGGGMFNPTQTWRRWHRKVNTTQKRHAMVSALAASALPPLVMARGHRVDDISELPLVVSDGAQSITKTKQALDMLEKLGCGPELSKVNASKKLRGGKGKMRDRKYTMRRGPLVVYAEDSGISRAVRNLPGVDHANVNRLNLLQLAPGGNFGRLVIYTEGAFKKLGELYGSYRNGSTEKKNYHLPRAMMTNADVARIVNSDEVQSVVVPAKMAVKRVSKKKQNGLKNKALRRRLNPAAAQEEKCRKRARTPGTKDFENAKKKQKKNAAVAKKCGKGSKAFYSSMMSAFEAAGAAAKKKVADDAAEE